MDSKVTFEKMVFDVFKTIIIEQNKVLLKEVAEKFNLDYDELLIKYIKPEYYLPVIENTKSKSKK
jgi:hypothetical protein